jgi:hypothetical protein
MKGENKKVNKKELLLFPLATRSKPPFPEINAVMSTPYPRSESIP